MSMPFNIYEFFRFMLPGGYIVLVLTLYLYAFFNISVPSQILSSQSVIYFFAAFIFSLVIDSRDIIQYGRGWFHEADHFQKDFPSKFLLKRCIYCDKRSSCNTPLSQKSVVSAWFNLFDEYVPDHTRKIVLTMGYLCRISFYFQIFSSLFFSVGVITTIVMLIIGRFPVDRVYLIVAFLVGLFLITQAIYLSNHVIRQNEKIGRTFRRGLNPYRSLLYVWATLGKKRDKPIIGKTEATGLWRRWSGYCEMQKEWLRINESLLKEKICKQRKEVGINRYGPD